MCVNTGTAAVHLAVQAIGAGTGDEVLVPTLTYVASFQAVAACGATPVACDVRETDGLLDLEDAARRLTARTRAVMPVHYASYVGDLDGFTPSRASMDCVSSKMRHMPSVAAIGIGRSVASAM